MYNNLELLLEKIAINQNNYLILLFIESKDEQTDYSYCRSKSI